MTNPEHPVTSSSSEPVDPAYAEEPDEIAPVDRQADPAQWFSGRQLLIITLVAVVAMLVVGVVCLLNWLTPEMHALHIPVLREG